ncbi:hypothetical protein [Leptospira noguchii]|nr:hypothetical protein [Leptospira noguchii]
MKTTLKFPYYHFRMKSGFRFARFRKKLSSLAVIAGNEEISVSKGRAK